MEPNVSVLTSTVCTVSDVIHIGRRDSILRSYFHSLKRAVFGQINKLLVDFIRENSFMVLLTFLSSTSVVRILYVLGLRSERKVVGIYTARSVAGMKNEFFCDESIASKEANTMHLEHDSRSFLTSPCIKKAVTSLVPGTNPVPTFTRIAASSQNPLFKGSIEPRLDNQGVVSQFNVSSNLSHSLCMT